VKVSACLLDHDPSRTGLPISVSYTGFEVFNRAVPQEMGSIHAQQGAGCQDWMPSPGMAHAFEQRLAEYDVVR
jgi:hypothetical protein